jgi:hypothetical protein
MKRPLLLVCLAMAIGGIAIPVAVAAPPATMTGEHFASVGGPGVVGCSTSGTFPYSASGVATGPYSGTFTESGTVTTTVITVPPFNGFVRATGFSATFTVYSPSGDVLVTGSKSLDTSVPNASVFCQNPSQLGGGGVATTYNATIFTPTGNYSDQGTSLIPILFTTGPSTTLVEDFTSSLLAPVIIAPTSKEQCKNGGWMNYPQFKNQGDCVSFVNNGK